MIRGLEMEEVQKLRNQIVLNSLYISDYENNMNVDPRDACDFFDGYMDFLQEIAKEDGFCLDGYNYDEFFRKYDNEETLEEWYCCFAEYPLYIYEESAGTASISTGKPYKGDFLYGK